MNIDLAIAGATGAVGEVIREILESRKFPVRQIHFLASERSAGTRLQYAGKSISVKNLAEFDFSQVQIAFFSAGGEVSATYAPIAAQAGAVVIDNTSYFRRDQDIPLLIPEVNGHRLSDYRHRNIIANPNCSTIQMLLALHPIHQQASITRINVATYQAVSGAGKRAMEELAGQTARLLNAQPIETKFFPKQIAFNAIPQIGEIQENGYSLEEMKIIWETRRIFEDDAIQVNPSCVRIPVFHGHSEAVHIETRDKITAPEARELLRSAPGVRLIDEPLDYPTPVSDAANADPVFVGRVREDISCDKGLNLWIVADNLRKGAALNSIQIAELLANEI